LANDGKLYNAKEFSDYYGASAKDKWLSSKNWPEMRMAKDGHAYSIGEFRDYYVDWLGEGGWMAEWHKAIAETREADDGKWYTWKEFVDYYGLEKSWAKWEKAKNKRPRFEL